MQLARQSILRALLLSLEPGAYTVVASGENNASGIALVEVYDASQHATAAQKVVNIASRGFAGSGENTLTAGGVPRGGNGLVIANLELRVPIRGNLGGALFVDGGNVFNRVSEIDLGELRGAVGFGARYRSPIGPLRLDMGFKLDRRELPGDPERRWEIHFSFGQAF